LDILQQLIGAVRDGNFLLVIVIVAVPLIFNFQKIVEFSEERKKARIVKLSEALNSPLITGLTKFHLEEELVTEQFKITTGIRLEKEIREAVIQAHINTKGELDFKHFKRALPHIFYKDLKLGVKISFFELASFWVNLIFGFILVLVGLLVMELPSQIKGISIAQGLGACRTCFARCVANKKRWLQDANRGQWSFHCQDLQRRRRCFCWQPFGTG
jgi:hypothetical protein